MRAHTKNERFFLKDKAGKIISHEYYYILFLGDDHFAVCDMEIDVRFLGEWKYYDIINGNYDLLPSKMKWGVIRVNRDKKGKFVSKGETMIVPCVYDRIEEGSKIAIAYHNDKYTYLDINRDSKNYGKQLLPCVLGYLGLCHDIYQQTFRLKKV